MPPKKKAKSSAHAASTPAEEEDTPMPDVSSPSKPVPAAVDILKDPWTDEQETSLFKGIIKWKPAGMHKHFRMIALSEHLRNHGYDETHTRIPGIWEKLRGMYDLDTIDERENFFGEEDGDTFLEFDLPEEDYREGKLTRFLKGERNGEDGSSEAPSSPRQWDPEEEVEVTGKRARRKREGTVEDTDRDEAKSSPAKPARRGRGAARGGRGKGGEGSSRAPSTQATEEDDEEDDEEEETGEEEGEEEGTPSVKARRGKRKAEPAATRKSKRAK